MDPKPIDKAVHEEIYPQLKEIEQRLGEEIALPLWINLTRKLATRGQPLEKLKRLLDDHYTHQVDYNERKANSRKTNARHH
jgi:hypothetical protein